MRNINNLSNELSNFQQKLRVYNKNLQNSKSEQYLLNNSFTDKKDLESKIMNIQSKIYELKKKPKSNLRVKTFYDKIILWH